MRWVLLTLAALVVCSGQMCGVPAAADRLEVNDHLRSACYPYGMGDLAIDTMISGVEADRLAGWDYSTELALVTGTCSNDPEPFVCTACATAIIDQVYGK